MANYSTYIERNNTFGLQSNYNDENTIDNTFFLTNEVSVDVEKIVQVVHTFERVQQILAPNGKIIGNLKGHILDTDDNIILNNQSRSFSGDILSNDGSLLVDSENRALQGNIIDSNGQILLDNTSKIFYGNISGNITATEIEGNIVSSSNGEILLDVSDNILLANVGSTMIGTVGEILLDVANNRIRNLVAPTTSTDAATKGYVDSVVSGGSGVPDFEFISYTGGETLSTSVRVFIDISGNDAIVNINLSDSSVNGSEKKIILISINGSATRLRIFPIGGNFISASGTTPSYIEMDTIGQGIHLIWYNMRWYNANGGATIV